MRFKLIAEVHLFLFRGDEILLLCRKNTGYEDGNYSVVAGHIDGGETARCAMSREAYEEAGIEIELQDLSLCHVMHRQATAERVSFFFTTQQWRGEVKNMEPEKCSSLDWFKLAELPQNMVAYVDTAIKKVQQGELYSEHGW